MTGIIDGILGIVRENFKAVAALAFGAVAGAELGYWTLPEVPDGGGLVVSAAVVVALGGWMAGGKIYSLLPEEEGIYIVAFEAADDSGGSVWELTEDKFAAMDVVEGTLFQWDVSSRVYEVREYRPEENVAVGNWRESVAGSELAGDVQVVDALEAIGELRDEFEPEAQKFRQVQRRLRSVARKMDRRRDRDQQAILDPHLTPEFGNEEGATISEVLHDEMPDHLLPESMKAGDATDDAQGESGEFAGFEILDDADGLDAGPEPEIRNND